LISEFQGHL